MKKLSIKDVVEFRRKSDRSKQNFANNIKLNVDKAKPESGGGDYWVTSISAISNSYKLNDIQPVLNKKDELEGKYDEADLETTKTMYKKNIDVLIGYEEFDFDKWRPSKEIEFIKKDKKTSILTINELQVKVSPHHVFVFENNGVQEIGAIWFVAKLDGYKNVELGMFADILYKHLTVNFSRDYCVNSKYCIAVDVCKGYDVNYLQLEKGEIPTILDSTIDEIVKLIQ